MILDECTPHPDSFHSCNRQYALYVYREYILYDMLRKHCSGSGFWSIRAEEDVLGAWALGLFRNGRIHYWQSGRNPLFFPSLPRRSTGYIHKFLENGGRPFLIHAESSR